MCSRASSCSSSSAALWDLPQWLLDLSPFVHSPKLPGDAAVLAPTVALTLIAAALTALGYLGWRRRDLAT